MKETFVDLTKEPGFHAAQQPPIDIGNAVMMPGGLYALQPEPVTEANPLADVHAAIKFLTWCALNQKPTALAIEWLTAAALKVAK